MWIISVRTVLTTVVMLWVTFPALADGNSKTGIPMASTEVRSLYVGNSALWSNSKAYFMPSGMVVGLYGSPIIETYKGTWSVSGNRMCMSVKTINISSKMSDGKTFTDCWAYYRTGSDVYAKRTSNWRSIAQPIQHQTQLYKKDHVTLQYKKLGGTL